MTTFKRFSLALVLTLFVIVLSVPAQTPQVSTVNVTTEESKVRISAAGDVLDMRVVVSDESGDVVFESGPVAGDRLDWTMRSADGARVPAGSYTLSVTYRASNGKLKRRVEQVLVTEEVAGSTSAAPEDPTPQAIGTITGQGTSGKLSKFTGANSIGNSVLTESAGRIGLGTTTPSQSLHVLGATSGLRLQSTGGASLTTTDYAGNGRVWQVGVGGSTAAGGVANKFFVRDLSAGQYRLAVDLSGNVGIGTTTPTAKLSVNGSIQILGAGNGIKFADGSIQTKATSGTINGTGTANRLAKFTGPNSFGNSSITEVSGKVGIGTAAPAVAGLHIGSGVPGGQAQLRLDNSNGTYGGLNRWADRLEVMSSNAIGLSAGGVGQPGLWLGPDGTVQIGPGASTVGRLNVASPGGGSTCVVATITWGTPVNGSCKNALVVETSDPSANLIHGVGTSGTVFMVRGTGDVLTTGLVTMRGTADFGAATRQMLNLFNASYGIGVQNFAQYYRTDFNFNWYRGGAHNDQDTDAGGGTLVMRLDSSGNLTTKGTVNGASDRNLKSNFAPVNPRLILDRLAAVPVRTWNYKGEPAAVRHIGPTAQDFSAAFNVGADDRHISMVDADGVALASIQALYQMMLEKDRQIERLQAQLNQVRRAVRQRRAGKR